MFNFPVELMPFIGRNKERSELRHLLTDPASRLITLAGPGGTGKTRLAIEAAKDNASNFADGIYFVGLQPVDAGGFLISSIASTLRYSLRGVNELDELLDYVRDKELLLLLDNFEHLVDSADLLNMLMRDSRIKLLVTSREVLNLREEWVYPVQGLPFPADPDEPDLETYGAVQLFLERARRVQHDFSLDVERVHVAQLCQFLEGMPLALELAASWLKSLPCSAIIKEIERSPDFLNTPLRNLPTRHRSMRAVFEQSWKLLEDENRQVFKALSVFRGGFLRDAAEYVSGATLHMLTALVDKSLIRRESTGRYQIHELLRQYAAEQLSADSVENQHIHERHISYYMNLLRQHEPDLNSSRQQETIRELEAELDNIRAAWRHAVDNANVRALQKGAHAYYVLSDMRGRYLECIDAVEKAIKCLESLPADEERDYTLAILNSGLLGLCIRLGRFERAQAACETSIRLYDKLERPVSTGFGTDPLASGALLAVTLGDYEGALQLCERAARQIAPDDQLNLMFLYYVQANAAYSLGELESAFQVAQRGYQISSDLGDNFFGAYLLIVMGNIAQALEDYNRAWEYYRISYRLKKEFNERGGMAAALNFMARIAWLRGSLQEAEALFQRGCNLYREVNDPGGMATSLMGLGDTAQAQGDYLTARRYFCDALKIASDIHWTPLILALFVAISDLLIQTDATAQALDLLSLVSAHPATERLTKIRMQKLLTASSLKLPALPVDTTPANLEAAVVRVREQLELTDGEHVHLAAPPDNPPAPKGTDALSERELEILRLLAEGLTNQQIADQLILVIGTVKAHNHHIFAKLGVSNRVMAIARARELGLI